LRHQVHLPFELLRSSDIRPTEKLLYLVIEAACPQSIYELAQVTGSSPGNASRACASLAKAGWIEMVKKGRSLAPVPVLPKAIQEKQVKRLMQTLGLAPQKGEFLMKRWLDVLVCSDEFVDNARPLFLLNPLTDEPLEFDRYYLEGIAFEFNGAQHYGPTQVYPSEQAFKELRTRDLLKKAMSVEKGIVLVEVTADDLSLQGMQKRIPRKLPQSNVDINGVYVKALGKACQDYRAKVGG